MHTFSLYIYAHIFFGYVATYVPLTSMCCHDSIQVIIQLFYLRLSNIVLTNYSKQGRDPAAFYRVPTIAKLCRQEGIGWVVVSRNNIWRFLHFYMMSGCMK